MDNETKVTVELDGVAADARIAPFGRWSVVRALQRGEPSKLFGVFEQVFDDPDALAERLGDSMDAMGKMLELAADAYAKYPRDDLPAKERAAKN